MIKIMKIEPRHYTDQRRMLNSSLGSDDKIIDVFCDIFKEGKYHIVKEYPFDMSLEQLYDHAFIVDDIPINVGDVVRMGDTYNVCLPFGWKALSYEEIFTR